MIASMDPEVTLRSDVAWSHSVDKGALTPGGQGESDLIYIPSQNALFYGIPGFYLSLFVSSTTILLTVLDSTLSKVAVDKPKSYDKVMAVVVVAGTILIILALVFLSFSIQGMINLKFPLYPSHLCYAKDMGPVDTVRSLLLRLQDSPNPMLQEVLEFSGDSYSNIHSTRWFLAYLFGLFGFIGIYVAYGSYIMRFKASGTNVQIKSPT
jgi:hypothetical protein